MSGSTFGGGQIDVASLLGALDGRPLRASLQETFTPASGGPLEERSGSIQVGSRSWVRIDVRQGPGPQVTFAYDLVRGRVGGGLSDAPESWSWFPWHIGQRAVDRADPRSEPLAATDAVVVEGMPCHFSESRVGSAVSRDWYAPELGISVRLETITPEGEWLFRLYDIRHEEPDPGQWPVVQ